MADPDPTRLPPHPGSPAAIAAGCTCPVLDNCHGLGCGRDGARHGWWISVSCPLHGPDSPEAEAAGGR